MTADHLILIGVFDGFSWIRCEGKGSFLNSPLMKAFGDERMESGESKLVVDLSACTGMDSTFMGTLAGMASRLSAIDGGSLEIADADERNRRSLEDLGLDYLMKIDPPAAQWRDQLDEIRKDLSPVKTIGAAMDQAQRAKHVLVAHEVLSNMNDENAHKFANVVGMLKTQVSSEEDSDDK